MRIHSVQLTAFGPFAGTVTVDLDRLGAAGPFLLHGQTGAGKTTVLDAIGFALFGAVPGARGTALRLRSDHAAADLPTEVVLECSFSGIRLRIRRRPAWDRPKKRGDGTTREQASVLVEDLDGVRPAIDRLDEAGDYLGRLVGMTAEQFFQVVLLPQGEFARFLRSRDDDRKELLEHLFGTSRFAAVEEHLARLRREAFEAVAAHDVRRDGLGNRLMQALGSEAPVLDPEVAVAEAAALEGVLAAAAAEAEATAVRRAVAAEHARQVEEQTARVARRRSLLATRDALLAQSAEIEAARRQVELARQAAPAVGPVRAAARAAAAVPPAAAAVTGAAASLQLPEDTTAHAVRAAEGECRAAAGALTSLVELERGLAERARAAEGLVADVTRLEVRRAALLAERAELPAELAVAEKEHRAAEQALGALPRQRERTDALLQRAVAAARLAELEPRLLTARTTALDARDEVQQLRAQHQDLRERRLDGMAAELAAGLVAGAPCAVCGSVDHPAPAAVAPDAVTRAQEQAAAEAVQRAEVRAEELAEQAAQLQAEVAALAATAGGVDAAEARRAAQEAGDELAELQRLAAGLDEVAARLLALRRRDDELIEADGAVLEELAAAQERQAALTAAVLADGDRVVDAREGHPTVAARQRALVVRADGLGRLAGLVDAHDALVADAERRAEEAATALALTPFAGVQEALAAALDPPFVEALQERCTAWEADVNRVTGLVDAPENQVEPGAEAGEPQLAAARAALAAADEQAQAARSRTDALAGRLAAVRDLASQLVAAAGEAEPARARAAEIKALAELAAGSGSDNALGMRLSAFVLAARLEQVALAASGRLQRMSGGRYTLVHSDDRRDRRSRGGLGLRVLDEWSGMERDPATLSGGETFLASLALALGLADVVTAEAGGERIDTLFVDEGFGSLDPEALEEVLDVLDQLRAGNRTVGLVSHVPEMRERIMSRLHVVKQREGSRLVYEGC
jgi:exonuclease SbcC